MSANIRRVLNSLIGGWLMSGEVLYCGYDNSSYIEAKLYDIDKVDFYRNVLIYIVSFYSASNGKHYSGMITLGDYNDFDTYSFDENLFICDGLTAYIKYYGYSNDSYITLRASKDSSSTINTNEIGLTVLKIPRTDV